MNSFLDKIGTKMARPGYFSLVVIISTMVACLSELTLASCISKGRQFHTNILFKPQFCIPQFYLSILIRLSKWKRKQTFYSSEQFFFSVLDQWNVYFLFQLLKWEKMFWKIGDNKIGGLVVWCHEQDMISYLRTYKVVSWVKE